ncbi:MAG TPA: ABC transporter ATP-binding protein [Vicinamibacteria bacterium]|nr:ABC transporter ATP-binding protein [Vicinamibacteria bacterium]
MGSTPAGQAPIVVDGLVCRYGRREVVRGLDLRVQAGETMALVGENGCGKTTSIRALLGAVRPFKGRCELLGADSVSIPPATFERIGVVAESHESYDDLTPAELFSFLSPFYPRWDRALAGNLTDVLDLPIDRRIGQLSRGGRMKAAIVSALAYHPEVVLLDEPLAGLDELAKESVLLALKSLRGKAATLICSHELDDIERYVDRVTFMSEGRAQWSLSTDDLRRKVRVLRFTHTGRTGEFQPTWARFTEEGGFATLVETEFDDADTAAAVRAAFANVENYAPAPASLKDAFRAFATLRKSGERP